MPRKKIIAGPWLGEFGWELMRWQGIFRKLHDKGWGITMVARLGHEALYEDYIDEFIPARELGFEESGPTDGWRINGKVPTLDKLLLDGKFSGYKYMGPMTCMMIGIDPLGAGQRFITYGKKYHTEDEVKKHQASGAKDEYFHDFLIHARSTSKGGTDKRNWPEEKWCELIDEMCVFPRYRTPKGKEYNAACIGSPDGAMHFQGLGGVYDYRGQSMENLIKMISKAKCIVGPSSGPMHLASLCGTPQIVFTDKKHWGSCNGTNRERYEKNWNPKGTKTIILDEDDWQPPVEKVKTAIERLVNGEDTSDLR